MFRKVLSCGRREYRLRWLIFIIWYTLVLSRREFSCKGWLIVQVFLGGWAGRKEYIYTEVEILNFGKLAMIYSLRHWADILNEYCLSRYTIELVRCTALTGIPWFLDLLVPDERHFSMIQRIEEKWDLTLFSITGCLVYVTMWSQLLGANDDFFGIRFGALSNLSRINIQGMQNDSWRMFGGPQKLRYAKFAIEIGMKHIIFRYKASLRTQLNQFLALAEYRQKKRWRTCSISCDIQPTAGDRKSTWCTHFNAKVFVECLGVAALTASKRC